MLDSYLRKKNGLRVCENEIAAVGSLFSLMVCSFICLLVCVLACKFYRMPFNNVVSSFSLSFGGAEKGKLCTLLPYYYRALLLAESGGSAHTEWRSVAAGGVYLVLLLWC
jgi:hypothetical protein